MLKLPNRISLSSWCISETAGLIICEISLFVTAANREAILLVKLREFGVARLEELGSESVNSTRYPEVEKPIRAREKQYPLF